MCSWSTSGSLLASGSDDTYLNIWEHNPSSIARPFTLNTSVATGHHANIFSVKFMPHSGDRTVVTCAGDSEVRVFDLEYGGAGSNEGDATASTRSRRFNDFFRSARWFNEANTNARVYRSHSDRAKRIVTESSPHLFLTCSEDGEVRQWDLRQPSSAYPSPHGIRRLGRFRMMPHVDGTTGEVPPPLISYKKYDLDLNSISCSSSQPHYIALGGAHLHCFLHDRRMLGRDISDERGQPDGIRPTAGSNMDEVMREATKCVRRFAPNNKRRMQTRTTGHITACKISDARPNELISSWSGDHIYSFDIVKSPDARDTDTRNDQAYQATRLRNRSERKRKRAAKVAASLSSLGEKHTDHNVLHRVADETQEEGHTAVRVRYGNGETEELSASQGPEAVALLANDALLTEAQRQAQRVAKALVSLRKTLFDFSAVLREDDAVIMENSSELTPFTSSFTNALGQACSILPEMEEIMNGWSYPINPTPEEVELQNTLRKNRQSAWRFVQAAGVLSKVLGGKLQTMSSAHDPRLDKFTMVRPAPREKITVESRFYYDFMKAILLWLDGGARAVLQGFKKTPNIPPDVAARFPFDDEDNSSNMPEKLRTTLYALASEERPVFDLEKNKFLVDEMRWVFQSQTQAVNAFARALTHVELQLHQGLSEPGIYSSGSAKRVMDKGAAARFWGVKVGRSLLMDAAQGVEYAFVQQAFGGSNIRVVQDMESSSSSSADGENIVSAALEMIAASATAEDIQSPSHSMVSRARAPEIAEELGDVEVDAVAPAASTTTEDDEEREQSIILEEEDDDENEAEDGDQWNINSDDDQEDDDDSDEEDQQQYSYRSRISYGRPRIRASVNLDVPYSTHSKVYKGHCNTRTVKDVNYYGLDDEYVVSGSDDGHFFIWDRKTCQIVNILEGDGEVVNVVQGHPYEPMIACSGIDSTVKIFGPGGNSRERYRAANGIDIANPGGSVHSSLRFGGRSRRAAADSDDEQEQGESPNKPEAAVDETKDEPVAKGGLKSRKAIQRDYEITSQNDAERQRGFDDISVTVSGSLH